MHGMAVSNVMDKVYSLVSACVLPSGPKQELAQQIVLALFAGMVVIVLGPVLSVAAAIAAALGVFILFGPTRVVLSLYLLFILATHQYLFPVTLPAAGVEWQVRELFLFAILGHWFVKTLQGRTRFSASSVHFGVGFVAIFFAMVTCRGLFSGNDLTRVIAESRNPVSLASYVVFASLIHDRRELGFYMMFVLVVSVLTALGAVTFSVAATASGFIVQAYQCYFGELIQKSIGPLDFQMFRPNGHEWFEVCAVTLMSLCFCTAISRKRRLLYAILVGVFVAAMLVGVMRTAYAVLFASTCILVFISIPNRAAQVLLLAAGVSVALVLVSLFGLATMDYIASEVQWLDRSLTARMVEMEGAWRMFMEAPVLGQGMGSSFKGLGIMQSGAQTGAGMVEYMTIHNVWMYWLFKGGVVGLSLITLGLLWIFFSAYGLIPRVSDQVDRCLLRGLTAGFAGQLVGALAMPRFTYVKGIVMIAMFAAAFYAFGRIYRPPTAPAPEEMQ